MSFKPSPALLAAIVTIAAVLPASAQGFNPDEIKRMQSQMPNIGRPYTIRVTTGAVTNEGFEKDLTNTDPNLRHWCWVPITTARQAYIHMAPGQVDHGKANVARPTSVYAKYKPVAVAMPRRNWDLQYPKAIASRPSHSASDVHGSLTYSKEPPRIAQETKNYAGSYGDVSGRLTAPHFNTAYEASTNVSGKLMR